MTKFDDRTYTVGLRSKIYKKGSVAVVFMVLPEIVLTAIADQSPAALIFFSLAEQHRTCTLQYFYCPYSTVLLATSTVISTPILKSHTAV